MFYVNTTVLKKQKNKKSLSAIVMVAILLSSFICNLFYFNNLLAITKASEMKLADRTNLYLKASALKGCFMSPAVSTTPILITEENAKNGIWFDGSKTMYAGASNGDMSCNSLVSEFKELLGYGSFAGENGFLCEFKKKRAKGGACETGVGEFESPFGYTVLEGGGTYNPFDTTLGDQLDKIISDKLYDGAGVKLEEAGWYVMYAEVFGGEKLCHATLNDTLTTASDTTYIGVITYKADTKDVAPHNYDGASKKTKVPIRTDLGTGSKLEMSCEDVASHMNNYADDYKNYLTDNPDEVGTVPGDPIAKTEGPGGKTTCAVDGVGWIVCPVMNFLATITEQAFNVLANNFLKTDTNLINSDSSSGTYKAWKIMRDIANVAFVIAFLVIIFSQLSSIGLDNYGIKKLLPKIIIAAILVNLSYVICQIAVDISNILGFSFKNLFDSLSTYMKTPETVTGSSKAALEFAGTVTALLAGGITFALVISIPIIISAFFALMVILIILMARTALIILLIVISPLAFVAFLLPNTEEYFTKWRKMFTALLLVFPIISVVFGASGLAANIIKLASNDDFGKIMALGIATIPLFIVPGLLKKAIDSAGNIGAKISGAGDKMSGHFGKKGEEAFNTSRLGQYQKFRQQERATRKGLIQSGAYKGRFKYDPRNAVSSINKGINESKLSGRFGDYSSASGIDASEKIKDEQVKMQRTLIADGINKSSDGIAYASDVLDEAMKSGDAVKTRAAYAELVAQGGGGVEKAREIIEKNSIATATNPINDKQNESSNDLRKYIKTNNSDIENKDARIFEWATGKSTSITNTANNSSDHLKTLSNAQVISQTPESIMASNIDKARAMEILADDNLKRDFKSKQVDALKLIISTRP